ncbi:MAG: anti-sigma factor [Solirubrobacteraceae bacterium]
MDKTPNNPEHTRGGCGLDVTAYALGALDAADAEAFAAHLETCAMCREELVEFEAVVATLPMSVPQHTAPDSLRRRVLDTVQQESHQAVTAQERGAPRWAWLTRITVPRPALAIGAAVAVLALIVLGGLALGPSSSPGTHVYAAQVTGATGTAQVKVTGGHAELVLRHFSPPPAGKIYEVWVARPHHSPQPTSALFSVTSQGNGDVGVPANLRGVNVIMVTPEPPGGSRVPTHSPVILARLA